MRIADLYQEKKNVLSFEIFPPKREDELKNIDATLEILCELKQEFPVRQLQRITGVSRGVISRI